VCPPSLKKNKKEREEKERDTEERSIQAKIFFACTLKNPRASAPDTGQTDKIGSTTAKDSERPRSEWEAKFRRVEKMNQESQICAGVNREGPAFEDRKKKPPSP